MTFESSAQWSRVAADDPVAPWELHVRAYTERADLTRARAACGFRAGAKRCSSVSATLRTLRLALAKTLCACVTNENAHNVNNICRICD